jgi:hypothetical protein
MSKCRFPTCKQRKDRCIKPNPWIEHLVAWGGKGLTRQQLKQKYTAKRPAQILTCRRVRNRGRDWHLDADVVASTGAYEFLSNPSNRLQPHESVNMRAKRQLVVKEMTKRSNPDRMRTDFDYKDITLKRLKKLVEIIDKVYWNGTLMKAIEKRIEIGSMIYRVVDKPHKNWSGLATVWSRQDNKPGVGAAKLSVNVDKYKGPVHKRRSSGLDATSKLDDLSITVQHELMHMLVYVSDYLRRPDEGNDGHGITWRRAWHNFHGGSDTIYTYDDNPQTIQL